MKDIFLRFLRFGVVARGLDAIASGFSLRYPDDMENLEHQFQFHNALYARCRLDIASTGKG